MERAPLNAEDQESVKNQNKAELKQVTRENFRLRCVQMSVEELQNYHAGLLLSLEHLPDNNPNNAKLFEDIDRVFGGLEAHA